MTGFPGRMVCDRGRAWAALAPDRELSELEQKLLRAHLARCAACRTFAGNVAATTAELRAAALEPLLEPIVLPRWRRRRTFTGVRAAGAAAAVALMAVGIASRAPLPTGDRESLQLPRVTDFSGGDEAEIRSLRVQRREAIASANTFRNRPAKRVENQPA